MKKYKIKKTKELLQQLKPFWKKQKDLMNEFYGKLFELELQMEKETGIKGITFFLADNEIVGIGNLERTMALIQKEEFK